MAERQPLIEPCNTTSEDIGEEAADDEIDSNTAHEPSTDLRDLQSNAILKAQGHDVEMERSFSPLAALGLGFR